ncbi:MAG: DUF72 domain-containing protein [Candidatus Binatales bacterium]
MAESDKLSTPVERTASWVYARLRKETYDDAGLKEWARRLQRLAADGCEVYAYLKHEDAAPDLAERLLAMVQGSRGAAH